MGYVKSVISLINYYFLTCNFKDDLNEKLRVAEDSAKQVSNIEDESKSRLDELEKLKLDAEGKLEQCLGRERGVFDDLQKLKVRKLYLIHHDKPFIYFNNPNINMAQF